MDDATLEELKSWSFPKLREISGIDPSTQLSPIDVLSGAGRTVDSVTGAPTRAALGAMQQGPNGEPPSLRGMLGAFKSQFGENPDKAPTPEDLLRNDPSGATTPYASNPFLQAAVGGVADWSIPATMGLAGAAKGVGKVAGTELGQNAFRGLGNLLADEAGQVRIPTQVEPNRLGLYSKLQAMIQKKVGPSATSEQVRGVLRDVKPEEVQYSGIDAFLNANPKVNKDQLLQHIQSNQPKLEESILGREDTSEVRQLGEERQKLLHLVNSEAGGFNQLPQDGRNKIMDRIIELDKTLDRLKYSDNYRPTKYDQYATPGGTNYQENLLKLQSSSDLVTKREQVKDALDRMYVAAHDKNPILNGYDTQTVSSILKGDPEYSRLAKQYEQLGQQIEESGVGYQSSHWPRDQNVLAHTRSKNFIDTEGQKVLHLDEVQSDWHQQGREHGYQNGKNLDLIERKNLIQQQDDITNQLDQIYHSNNPDLIEAAGLSDKLDSIEQQLHNGTESPQSVPNAPFKKTWHELALKTQLRKAAEQDVDKLTWSTGEQQADRYDLSKQLDTVEYNPKTQELSAWDTTGNPALFKQKAAPEQLENYIGKDAAKNLLSTSVEQSGFGEAENKVHSLSNQDLKVGGEGMKGFYDKIIPDYLNKLGKQYDTKVGTTEIPVSNWKVSLDAHQDSLRSFNSKEAAEQYIKEFQGKHPYSMPQVVPPETITVHSLKLTPEFKKAILTKGFPMFVGAGVALTPDKQE